MLALGSTKYTVHAITSFGGYKTLQEKAVAVVCGKRGAQYLLLDNGSRYTMTVYNIGDTTKG